MYRVILAAVLLCLSAAPGFADGADQPEGVYEPAGGSGFYAALRGAAVFTGEEVIGPVDYNTGFGIIASGGYAFDFGLAVEGEFSWRRLTIDGLVVADLDLYNFMANVLYELAIGPVRPYAGGGIGVGVVHIEGIAFIPGPIDNTETDFAWQVIGGLAVPVDERLDLVVDYRYGATNLEFDDEAHHSVTGGARFRF